MSPDSQLSLFRRRGGARPGAGRKPGPNPRVRHLSRPEVSARVPLHVTLKRRPGLPSLRQRALVRALEATLRGCAERGDFRLAAYTVQGNHLHLVVEADDRGALGRGMKALCARVARAVNRVVGRSGPVLADRYHLRLLKTPLEVRRALAYVLLNTRRHLAEALRSRGLLSKATLPSGADDPASSGRWFHGWRTGSARAGSTVPRGNGSGTPQDGEDPPAVAPARSWLLRVGWRRYGLLDPDEIPGISSHPRRAG